ncbi:MAG: hypothetical protein PVH87_03300 [Desulfobacteraceae bacterium]
MPNKSLSDLLVANQDVVLAGGPFASGRINLGTQDTYRSPAHLFRKHHAVRGESIDQALLPELSRTH